MSTHSNITPSWADPSTDVVSATTPAEALVLEFLEGLTGPSGPLVDKYFAEDATYHNMPSCMVPSYGRDAIKATLAALGGALNMEEILTYFITSRGPYVVTERVDRIRSGEKTYDILLMGIFKTKDGRIAEWRDYYDSSDMAEGLGLKVRS